PERRADPCGIERCGIEQRPALAAAISFVRARNSARVHRVGTARIDRELADLRRESGAACSLPRLALIDASPDAIVGAGVPNARAGFGYGERRDAPLKAPDDSRPGSTAVASLEHRHIGMP